MIRELVQSWYLHTEFQLLFNRSQASSHSSLGTVFYFNSAIWSKIRSLTLKACTVFFLKWCKYPTNIKKPTSESELFYLLIKTYRHLLNNHTLAFFLLIQKNKTKYASKQ